MFFVVQVVVGTAAAVIISSFKFLRVAGSFAYPTLWHIIDLHTRWQTCMKEPFFVMFSLYVYYCIGMMYCMEISK